MKLGLIPLFHVSHWAISSADHCHSLPFIQSPSGKIKYESFQNSSIFFLENIPDISSKSRYYRILQGFKTTTYIFVSICVMHVCILTYACTLTHTDTTMY